MTPKSLRNLWTLYFQSAIGADADPEDIEIARAAFYGGIAAFARVLQPLADSGDGEALAASIRRAAQLTPAMQAPPPPRQRTP